MPRNDNLTKNYSETMSSVVTCNDYIKLKRYSETMSSVVTCNDYIKFKKQRNQKMIQQKEKELKEQKEKELRRQERQERDRLRRPEQTFEESLERTNKYLKKLYPTFQSKKQKLKEQKEKQMNKPKLVVKKESNPTTEKTENKKEEPYWSPPINDEIESLHSNEYITDDGLYRKMPSSYPNTYYMDTDDGEKLTNRYYKIGTKCLMKDKYNKVDYTNDGHLLGGDNYLHPKFNYPIPANKLMDEYNKKINETIEKRGRRKKIKIYMKRNH